MTPIEEFIAILSDPSISAKLSKAKVTRTCKICGQPADRFRNAASKFEYVVSTICQVCQDKYLRPK